MATNNQPTKKTKGRRIKRKILFGILLIFIALQFFQPDKNNQSFDIANDISTVVTVPDSVHNLLQSACYDCHSNQTNYPWYANIQPLGWWLKDHIDEGKSHINFHEFALVEPKPGSPFNTKKLRQDHKLDEIYEQVETREMPLKSYTYIHRNAKLKEAEQKMLMDWVVAARKELMADSSSTTQNTAKIN